MKKQNTRRDFLKTSALLSVVGFIPGKSAIASTSVEDVKAPSPDISSQPTDSFTILYTSDIHAQLNTHDEFFWENNAPVYRKRGGLPVLKTMINSLRKENPNPILIDGGDFFHGHGLASLTEGEALIPILNNFDYDLILPGNWEVVYKKKKMLYDMGHATAAKICANMWHQCDGPENGELIYQPYWIKKVGSTKIGFIGYTDHLIPKRQSPAYSVGIKFEHADFNLARYIKLLKEVEGCGIIFVVTHMGLAQQVGLSNNPACEGADFILGADTHERVRVPIEGKYSKVVECGAFGSFIGRLKVQIENDKIKSYQYDLLDVDPEKYAPDAALQSMIDKALDPYRAELNKVIGVTTSPLVRYFVLESPMDNLLTNAIMWKFKPDIALSNGFRFCQPLAVGPSGKQNITKEFLWNMLPVNSEAKMGYVTGKQIMNWLEKELQNAFAKDPSKRLGGWFVRFAGMEVNVTIGNEMGKRVNWVKIKGKPLQEDKEYSIIACEREGDPDDTLCRIEKVLRPTKLNTLMHAVMEEYLAKNSPVSPKIEHRTTATDQPATLLTQLQGTTYEFH